MEETYHVTLSEDDEEISQTNTEGNYYFPYVPAFDLVSINSITIPDPITPTVQDINSPHESPKYSIANDHLIHHEPNDFDPAEVDNDTSDSQNITINDEPISEVEPLPTIISPSVEVIHDSSAHQDIWSREKHILLVNILGEPQAGVTTRSRVRDSELTSAHGLYVNFLSEVEPKKLVEALGEEVARLEAIRIFLAYAAYMGFMVYQLDLKSAFLNRKLSKEVYVQQPLVFESSEFPNYVCKMNKALYGLKQAPKACKKIFKYLKGTPNLGLWYPKGLGFNLKAYSDSDYAGCNLYQKSTSGGCQILGGKLVCWSAKRQNSVAMSSAEVEYVAAVGCCAQVLWMKIQLADYDILYDKVPIFCDNKSIIAISNNPVLHSRTKHIDIRYHFIRDYILKGDIELHFVPTNLQLVDIFTKPLAEPSFTRLVAELGMLNIEKVRERNVSPEDGPTVPDISGGRPRLETSRDVDAQSYDEVYGCLKGDSRNSGGKRLAISMVEEAWLSERKEISDADAKKDILENNDDLLKLHRQRSYANVRRKPLELQVGNRVMLKASPRKDIFRFGKQGKLNPRYIGPFKILERIDPVDPHGSKGYLKIVMEVPDSSWLTRSITTLKVLLN
ncbi:retrovirus-related pol polyprotein from transposon TNT 1-94 [Tanacetum coccineum]